MRTRATLRQRVRAAPRAIRAALVGGVVEGGLCELVRDSDVLGKYGPHEYEVLLVDTPPAKADEALHRIEGKLLERGLKCSVTLTAARATAAARTS